MSQRAKKELRKNVATQAKQLQAEGKLVEISINNVETNLKNSTVRALELWAIFDTGANSHILSGKFLGKVDGEKVVGAR